MTTYKRLRTDLKSYDRLNADVSALYPACVAIARAAGRDDLSAELAKHADNPSNMFLNTAFQCVIFASRKWGLNLATDNAFWFMKSAVTPEMYNQLARDMNAVLDYIEANGL